jgi:hypothetical protein
MERSLQKIQREKEKFFELRLSSEASFLSVKLVAEVRASDPVPIAYRF